MGLAAAPAILRALPQHAHAPAEIGGPVGSHRLRDLRAVQHVDALDRRGAEHFHGKPHRHRAGPDDVAHQRLAHEPFLGGTKLRVVGEAHHRRIEGAGEVKAQPRAGRAVVPPAAQRREQRIARELRHQVAGQAADRPERRGTGPRGAGPPLVIVAVAHHADAIALVERVMQQPLERAPGGMHLDGTLEPAVVRELDVRIAPADMGDDHGVLVLRARRTDLSRCSNRHWPHPARPPGCAMSGRFGGLRGGRRCCGRRPCRCCPTIRIPARTRSGRVRRTPQSAG